MGRHQQSCCTPPSAWEQLEEKRPFYLLGSVTQMEKRRGGGGVGREREEAKPKEGRFLGDENFWRPFFCGGHCVVPSERRAQQTTATTTG